MIVDNTSELELAAWGLAVLQGLLRCLCLAGLLIPNAGRLGPLSGGGLFTLLSSPLLNFPHVEALEGVDKSVFILTILALEGLISSEVLVLLEVLVALLAEFDAEAITLFFDQTETFNVLLVLLTVDGADHVILAVVAPGLERTTLHEVILVDNAALVHEGGINAEVAGWVALEELKEGVLSLVQLILLEVKYVLLLDFPGLDVLLELIFLKLV